MDDATIWRQLDDGLFTDAMIAQLKYDMAMVNYLIASRGAAPEGAGGASQPGPAG